MSLSSGIDIAVFMVAVAAIGGGIAFKDPAWAAVVVGSILLGLLIVSRVRTGGPKE